MENKIWEELCLKHLTLDQTDTPLEFDRSEVEQFYYPLALHLIEQSQKQDRLIVAVAGPPGCGKTSFASLLVAVINIELHCEGAVVVQQDGWHFPNVYLDTHTIWRGGQEIILRKLKGSPETYDMQAALAFLQDIKQGKEVDCPVYSRLLHDPVPHARTVKAAHRIVILEGNYWLLQEEPWLQFQNLFDVSIFLSANAEKLVDGLRGRHLRGGKTLDFTNQHMAEVDLPNIDRVLNDSAPAQIVVHKIDGQRIFRVDW